MLRSYTSLVLSSLLFVGLAVNFLTIESHKSEEFFGTLSDRVSSARIESGDETAPHRGSGR